MALRGFAHLRCLRLGLWGALLLHAPTVAFSQDCNNNGIQDPCDINCGVPGGPCDVPGCGTKTDCNANSIPDDCELAVVFELAADWSDVNNPNGVWSYNDGVGAPLPMNSPDLFGSDFGSPQPGWTNADGSSRWFKRIAPTSNNVLIPVGKVGATGASSGISWTSPFAGVVQVAGAIYGGHASQGGILHWQVTINGEMISDAHFESFSFNGPENAFNLAEGSGGMIALRRIVALGDVISLSYTNVVQPVPFVGIDFSVTRLNDCNANLIPDSCDLLAGNASDCDGNGIADACQPDCNANGVFDPCDILAHTSSDCNTNGVPDECDVGNSSRLWRRRAVQPPVEPLHSGLNSHVMAYDLIRRRAVIFGGEDYAADPFLRDSTWEFDGQMWTLVSGGFPTARIGASMTYDSDRKRMVLFGGGDNNGCLGDTWERTSDSAWTLRTINGPSPSPRVYTSMAYDIVLQRTVLFGGECNGTTFGDTWEWDGVTWVQIASSGPQQQSAAGMVFDAARNQTVFVGISPDSIAMETWGWNGSTWTQLATTGPEPRSGFAMAYDSTRERVVLHGGDLGSGVSNDTWEWNGLAWTRTLDFGAEGQAYQAMAYDPVRQKVLLVGAASGQSNPVSTWELGSQSTDCNENGIPDECNAMEVDCNSNERPDSCDIAFGFSYDCNSNQVPDECQILIGA